MKTIVVILHRIYPIFRAGSPAAATLETLYLLTFSQSDTHAAITFWYKITEQAYYTLIYWIFQLY